MSLGQSEQDPEAILDRLRAVLQEHKLDCRECRRPYRDPRRLQCGHVFCFDCIDTHINNNSSNDITAHGLTTFSCPQCDSVQNLHLDGSTRLPRDLFVRTLVEARDILNAGAVVKCTKCDGNRAAQACYTCSAYLCTQCNDVHQCNQTNGRQHETCSLRHLAQAENYLRFQAGRYSPCRFHPAERCTLFCKYDEKEVCECCVGEARHEGHFTLPLNKHVETQVAELRERTERFTEERRDLAKSAVLLKGKVKQLESHVTEQCQLIDQQTKQLTRKLQEYAHRLKKELTRRTDVQLSTLTETLAKYECQSQMRNQISAELSLLPVLPLSDVLAQTAQLYKQTSTLTALPSVDPHRLASEFSEQKLVLSSAGDPLLIAVFSSVLGHVEPESLDQRKHNQPSSNLQHELQDRTMAAIHNALDAVRGQERRPSTFTRIAQTVCGQLDSHAKKEKDGKEGGQQVAKHVTKSGGWQCVVATPGQLGYSITASKQKHLRVVMDNIEITVFSP